MLNGVYDNSLFSSYENALLDFGMSPLGLCFELLMLLSDHFQVVNEPEDIHCPAVEISTRSKLSCLSWNKYTKNQIASSDYEGIVTVWDVTTRQVVKPFPCFHDTANTAHPSYYLTIFSSRV